MRKDFEEREDVTRDWEVVGWKELKDLVRWDSLDFGREVENGAERKGGKWGLGSEMGGGHTGTCRCRCGLNRSMLR